MLKQETTYRADGGQEFAMSTFSVPGCEDKAQDIIVANGFSSGMVLSAIMARRLVLASRGGLRVTTYQEPLVGSSAYALDYQAERLANCVKFVAQESQLDILAHSRGIKTTALAGDQLVEESYLRSMVGLTPVGLVRGGLEPTEIARRLTHEVIRGVKEFSEASRARATMSVIGQIGLHGLAHPFKFAQEVNSLVGEDISDKVSILSKKLPMTMIVGSMDKVAPLQEVIDSLAASGYAGDIREIEAGHLSAFTDPSNNYEIVESLEGL